MSIEIEKKYRLTEPDRESLKVALTEAGAEFAGREFEVNTIYTSEALRSNSSILRVRTIGGRTMLTYKRRVGSDFGVKRQIEYETEVKDAEAIEAIIYEIGLEPALVYEKYRETWRFRSVEVVIDELPFGLFAEIEGSMTAIKEAEILLDIEHLSTEHETYPNLTAMHGKKKDGVTESRF